MSHLLTATRGTKPADFEAEPVMIDLLGPALCLTLDDGEMLIFDLEQFQQAVEGEQAPAGSRAA